jgi:ubiquitin C-terminal hydrolase
MTTLGCGKFSNKDGISCYMNSILAILQNTPLFTDYIINGEFKQDTIIYELQRIFKYSLDNNNCNITPNTFREKIIKKNSIWGELAQQDSHEFLTFLISSLEDEIKQKVTFVPNGINYIKKYKPYKGNFKTINDILTGNIMAQIQWQRFISVEYSAIKILFTGQFHEYTKCYYCNYTNNRFDIFQNIQLDITANNLIDCFENFNKQKRLDKNNKIYCEFCHIKNQAYVKTDIWKFPQILIINLKRFKMNDYGQIIGKNTQMVDYSEKLTINKISYSLFAVNLHYGHGINRGHYTSYVKNRYDNQWYEFDDNIVTPIDNIVTNCATLLFYYKI